MNERITQIFEYVNLFYSPESSAETREEISTYIQDWQADENSLMDSLAIISSSFDYQLNFIALLTIQSKIRYSWQYIDSDQKNNLFSILCQLVIQTDANMTTYRFGMISLADFSIVSANWGEIIGLISNNFSNSQLFDFFTFVYEESLETFYIKYIGDDQAQFISLLEVVLPLLENGKVDYQWFLLFKSIIKAIGPNDAFLSLISRLDENLNDNKIALILVEIISSVLIFKTKEFSLFQQEIFKFGGNFSVFLHEQLNQNPSDVLIQEITLLLWSAIFNVSNEFYLDLSLSDSINEIINEFLEVSALINCKNELWTTTLFAIDHFCSPLKKIPNHPIQIFVVKYLQLMIYLIDQGFDVEDISNPIVSLYEYAPELIDQYLVEVLEDATPGLYAFLYKSFDKMNKEIIEIYTQHAFNLGTSCYTIQFLGKAINIFPQIIPSFIQLLLENASSIKPTIICRAIYNICIDNIGHVYLNSTELIHSFFPFLEIITMESMIFYIPSILQLVVYVEDNSFAGQVLTPIGNKMISFFRSCRTIDDFEIFFKSYTLVLRFSSDIQMTPVIKDFLSQLFIHIFTAMSRYYTIHNMSYQEYLCYLVLEMVNNKFLSDLSPIVIWIEALASQKYLLTLHFSVANVLYEHQPLEQLTQFLRDFQSTPNEIEACSKGIVFYIRNLWKKNCPIFWDLIPAELIIHLLTIENIRDLQLVFSTISDIINDEIPQYFQELLVQSLFNLMIHKEMSFAKNATSLLRQISIKYPSYLAVIEQMIPFQNDYSNDFLSALTNLVSPIDFSNIVEQFITFYRANSQ